jgi:hypothetical protein
MTEPLAAASNGNAGAEDGTAASFDPLNAMQTAEPLSTLLTAEYLEHHGVMPLGFDDGRLIVGTWLERVDANALDDLRLIAGSPLEVVVLPEVELRAAIRRVYSPEALTAEDVIAGLADDVRTAV